MMTSFFEENFFVNVDMTFGDYVGKAQVNSLVMAVEKL